MTDDHGYGAHPSPQKQLGKTFTIPILIPEGVVSTPNEALRKNSVEKSRQRECVDGMRTVTTHKCKHVTSGCDQRTHMIKVPSGNEPKRKIQ